MVHVGEENCPLCGKALTYYDTVRRVALTKGRERRKLYIRRLRCLSCGTYHREIPSSIFPHKWYEKEIILGVIEGLITRDVLGFEDYPCEDTMEIWKSQNFQGLL